MKRLTTNPYRNYFLVTIFGVAMGASEAIVVIYLREIYYPGGFDFPLAPISSKIFSIELLRELATIVMLAAIAIITGKNNLQRFSYFLFTFAIWDIFYYVWLKILIAWPPSLITWDILFLIPVVWIGPVLAPVICSLTMILMSGIINYLQNKGYNVKIKPSEWILIITGAAIIFLTFIRDYSVMVIGEGLKSGFGTLSTNEYLLETISTYQPTSYNWLMFIVGEALIVIALLLLFKRTTHTS